MSYNESLSPNSNYPAMSQSQWDSAPFNEPDVPEKEFDVTISQTLSRSTSVTTNDWCPAGDEDDFYVDTSDTCWSEVIKENGCKTPLDLIAMLKEYLQKDLERIEEIAKEKNENKEFLERKYQFLIEECEGWVEDDLAISEE